MATATLWPARRWARATSLSMSRGAATLTLKHFVLRAEARALYREVLRSVRGLDAATAEGVRQAARERFADHANEMDTAKIRLLLVDGKHSLNEMRACLGTVSSGSRGPQ